MVRPVRHISIALALPTARARTLGAADARDDARCDLWLSEHGDAGCQPDVAEYGGFAATSEGEPGPFM